MTLPSDHQHQQRKESGQATDARLDRSSEGDGSWTVDDVAGRATTTIIRVEAPQRPPELHAGAAAALLKLLRRVNDHRTDNSIEENG
ncbi:hypothetical protein [Micromonospora noduli]|uniref:hypothetical protein n=1 Tax=Micromonospora noduli TaxID=709876 RepID=UPI000DD93EC1|nr:hypothetical protein [Micromonospora noduli]